MSGAIATGDGRDLFGEPRAQTRSGRQLPLPLGWRRHPEDPAPTIVIGDSNRAAIEHILGQANWTMPASLLSGPPQSGRSTIGAMFLANGGDAVIDTLSVTDEEKLFHRWNRAQADNRKLLIIVDSPDDAAAVRLPDLRTRLATAPLVAIGAPDSCLARDLIETLLIQRGLKPAAQVGSYVAARIERSYAAIHAAVQAIDAQALATGSGAAIPTARAALIAAGLYDGKDADSDSPETA